MQVKLPCQALKCEQFRFVKTTKVDEDAFHSVIIANRSIRWLKNLKQASWAKLQVVRQLRPP